MIAVQAGAAAPVSTATKPTGETPMADDFYEQHKRYHRFYHFVETELGRLFLAYDNASIHYWQNDQSKSISDRRLEELSKKAEETKKAFVDKLMELANV